MPISLLGLVFGLSLFLTTPSFSDISVPVPGVSEALSGVISEGQQGCTGEDCVINCIPSESLTCCEQNYGVGALECACKRDQSVLQNKLDCCYKREGEGSNKCACQRNDVNPNDQDQWQCCVNSPGKGESHSDCICMDPSKTELDCCLADSTHFEHGTGTLKCACLRDQSVKKNKLQCCINNTGSQAHPSCICIDKGETSKECLCAKDLDSKGCLCHKNNSTKGPDSQACCEAKYGADANECACFDDPNSPECCSLKSDHPEHEAKTPTPVSSLPTCACLKNQSVKDNKLQCCVNQKGKNHSDCICIDKGESSKECACAKDPDSEKCICKTYGDSSCECEKAKHGEESQQYICCQDSQSLKCCSLKSNHPEHEAKTPTPVSSPPTCACLRDQSKSDNKLQCCVNEKGKDHSDCICIDKGESSKECCYATHSSSSKLCTKSCLSKDFYDKDEVYHTLFSADYLNGFPLPSPVPKVRYCASPGM